MKVTMSLITMDYSTDGSQTRSMGNINKNYVRLTNSDASPIQPLPYVDGSQYSSFAAWTDAVGRGLAGLSNNTYSNTTINAVFDVDEELIS